jgi:hypothetical protein
MDCEYFFLVRGSIVQVIGEGSQLHCENHLSAYIAYSEGDRSRDEQNAMASKRKKENKGMRIRTRDGNKNGWM